MLLSRIPTLFLLFKLSAALKISIQPTVTVGKDVPLNWIREPSDPQSFKFSLSIALVGFNNGFLLKNADTDGKNQDSVNVNIPLLTPPGRYQILAVLSDSSQGPPGRQQPQLNATTDPFDVVPLGASTSREASTAHNGATTTPSSITIMTGLTPSDSDVTSTTPEAITTTGDNGRTIIVTSLVTTTRPVSSSSSAFIAGVSEASSSASANTTTSTSQAPSGSTSSSNVPLIVGSIFGAIVAAAVLSLCGLFLFRRYRRHKNDEALFSAERMVRTPSPTQSYLIQPEQTLNEKTRIAYYGID